LFVLLNLNNAGAFFHEQYLCILSKYSVVATIWLQKKKQRRIKRYDTGSCKFWFIILSLRNVVSRWLQNGRQNSLQNQRKSL